MTENTYKEWTQSGTHIKRQVSSHGHVPSGPGVRLQVAEHECLPRYPSQSAEWQKFLKDGHNKELFRFISKELQRGTADLHYELLTTNADLVLSNKPTDMTALSPCQQEESDTRMMLHLYHAAGQGHSKAFLDCR